MRRAFFGMLARLAAEDPRIVLLTGDLGYTVLEPFAEASPTRFINAGVAEQNMVGVATGLAEAGMIPFVYSIASFATLRPYEFIRNGPVHHRLPVRVIGAGGGLDYGHDGISHYGIEDVGVMRMQPGLTIVAPADSRQAASALAATWDLPQPVYYRLGKGEHDEVPGLDGRFELGRAQVIGSGRDVVLVTMGSIATEAAAAVNTLAGRGIRATLVVVSSMNPAPVDDLFAVLHDVPLAVTVEAHYVAGGVGSLAAEIVAERAPGCRLVRCGIRQQPAGASGSQRYLYDRYGISSSAIVSAVVGALDQPGTALEAGPHRGH
jgi:transketolase